MTDLLELVHGLRRRPSMYLGHDATFDTVVAFLNGHDTASRSLIGFHEFLVLRAGDGNNLWWPGLVRMMASGAGAADSETSADARALSILFDLVTEFLAEVHAGGLNAIIHEHQTWLRGRSWYVPDLLRLGSSPPPDLVTADEAAAILGLTRLALFESLGSIGLRPGRRGAEVLFRRADVMNAAKHGGA